MNPKEELARDFAERKLEEIRVQDIEDAKEPEWGSWITLSEFVIVNAEAHGMKPYSISLDCGSRGGVTIGQGDTRVEALRHGIETVTKILEEKIRIEEEKS